MAGTATLLLDGTVLVCGGYEADYDNQIYSYTNYSERYDPQYNINYNVPSSGKWSESATMNETPAYHQANLLRDGGVLVTGGNDGLQDYKTAMLYKYIPYWQYPIPNFSNTAWNYGPDMVDRRAHFQATTIHTTSVSSGGDVLVTGGAIGCRKGECYRSLRTVELYHGIPSDFLYGMWEKRDTMGWFRSDHTATYLNDGRVLVAGGYNWDTKDATALAEVWWDGPSPQYCWAYYMGACPPPQPRP